MKCTHLRAESHYSLYQSCSIKHFLIRSPPSGVRGRRKPLEWRRRYDDEEETFFRKAPRPSLPYVSPTPAEHWDASSKCRRVRRPRKCRNRYSAQGRRRTETHPLLFRTLREKDNTAPHASTSALPCFATAARFPTAPATSRTLHGLTLCRMRREHLLGLIKDRIPCLYSVFSHDPLSGASPCS